MQVSNQPTLRQGPLLHWHSSPYLFSHCQTLHLARQYYYGANNTIQHANVHSILDGMIGGLVANPDRKYIEVEQAFFQRWWAEQTPDMQNTVQGLVARGQLEFINGAWSMHDEASPSEY